MKLPAWTPKLISMLPLLVSLSVLTACAASRPSTEAKIALPSLPAAVKDCGKLSAPPERALTDAEIEKFWRHDRKAWKLCRNNNGVIIKYYEDLRNSLSLPGN